MFAPNTSQFVPGSASMRAVLGFGNLGKRLVEGVVGLFAILGFVYVPLGRHTGLEHTLAVLSTPAAAAAVEDLSRTALALRQRAIDFLTQHATPQLQPHPGDQPPEPRPVPPKLK
jgi:hypothetical protein